MTNNPKLHYKPGLTMDAPIPVTLAAADWVTFMCWVSQIDQGGTLDGVNHIIYGEMAGQIKDAIYTVESTKAAQAFVQDRMSQMGGGIGGMLFNLPMPGAIFPTADDFKTEGDDE